MAQPIVKQSRKEEIALQPVLEPYLKMNEDLREKHRKLDEKQLKLAKEEEARHAKLQTWLANFEQELTFFQVNRLLTL